MRVCAAVVAADCAPVFVVFVDFVVAAVNVAVAVGKNCCCCCCCWVKSC